ncbi:MAG: hypothetical protein ACI8WB_003631 [Phenylobacterium sp.]|jgi:hypothetical protein
MAILTNSGRSELVRAIYQQPVFMAWGRADGAWVTPPAESLDSSGLQDAIGYRQATQVRYCVPDEAGQIEVSSGKFSLSDEPTRHLYLQFRYDFIDAVGETIREIGVYLGTAVQAGLPAGQVYFTTAEVDDSGKLLLLENYRPLLRDDSVRESFDFVVTF